ncbi:MAG: FMN-binding protein, partial [Peptococcus niger]
SMYYGDEFGDDPTRTIFSIINGKADKSKATFEGLKTTYKGDSTDAVSGATITCNAAKESILNAFKVFEAQFKK